MCLTGRAEILGEDSLALLRADAGPLTALGQPSYSSTFTSHSGISQYKSSFGKIPIFPQVKQKQNSCKNYILATFECFYYNAVRYMCSDHWHIPAIPGPHSQFLCSCVACTAHCRVIIKFIYKNLSRFSGTFV